MFKNLFNKSSRVPNGALEDFRNDEELQKDYRHEEIIAKSGPVLKKYDFVIKNVLPAFRECISVHNQNGAGSCVAHSIAAIAAVMYYLQNSGGNLLTRAPKFSARWIYPRRMNRPQEGMHFIDACKIFTEVGQIFNELVPGDNMTEEQMQELHEKEFVPLEQIAKHFAPKKYIWLPHNFDSFGDVLNMLGLPILMGVKFAGSEWKLDIPLIKEKETKYGHAIVALPFTATILPNGKRAFLIIDSWGINNSMKGFRWLTEDWFTNNRILAGIYFIDMLKKDNESKVPKYTFNKDLCWGMVNDPDVFKLQEVLYALGYFDHQPTGNFYGITLKAVKDYQKANKIEPVRGYFGPLTRASINEKLNN